jgi:Protein of unknown function (DUF3106)
VEKFAGSLKKRNVRMTLRRQLGASLLALILSAGVTASCVAESSEAQRQHNANRPPAAGFSGGHAPMRQPAREVRQQQAQEPRKSQAAPPVRNDRPANAGAGRGARAADPNANANRPPANANRPPVSPNRAPVNPNRAGAANRTNPNPNPNRPPNASQSSGTYRGNQNRLSPEERQRVVQNEQRFKQLSPQQKQDMRARSRVWQQMTPQQRDHIQNEVLPAWRNLPSQRQKAISQRLGVLQNMPESARNQHLSDPNFTRGMNEQDRATLRDLSHLHVGGAPDPPNE